jgi:hypothetical protein
VACAALAAGAHYVDPAGDETLHAALSDRPLAARGQIALLSAGMVPGWSALLGRALAAAAQERPQSLTVYAGGRDRFTLNAAADFVTSLDNGYGKAQAAWRNGVQLVRSRPSAVPGFAPSARAYPYLSQESERLARSMGLRELTFYNVFDGPAVNAAVEQLAALRAAHGVQHAAAALQRASELDLFGCAAYQQFIYIQDEGADQPVRRRTLHMRGVDAHALTGALAAFAARSALASGVAPGLHYAAEALPAAAATAWLKSSPAVHYVTCSTSTDRGDAALLEEGVL